MCADHDEVRPSRARVQQNHGSRVAVLHADLEAHTDVFRRLPKRCVHGHPFLGVPAEWVILSHGVHDGKLGVPRPAQGESLFESGLGRVGEVDSAKDARYLIHVIAPRFERSISVLYAATPSKLEARTEPLVDGRFRSASPSGVAI
jgi:hypothetical protein